MKIAIYTISKNESKFVDRFMDSVKEADVVVVADTGSSDNTVELLKARGAEVYQIKVDPWRFDIARNISMQLVPEDVDVCVCIDLDEVLTPGWRAAIEKSWESDTCRLRYTYIWNTLPDGKDGTTFWYDKIHLRKGFRWVKPVHEILEYSGTEKQTYCHDFKLYHYPDNTKSRSSYLPLLEIGCKETPEDDRNSHYFGRELMYYDKFDEAIVELKRHLLLPRATWLPERAASMRFIGRCYTKKGDLTIGRSWAMKACAECPGDREPWVDLGKIYYFEQNFEGAYFAMKQALKIVERPMSYIQEPEAWGSYPHDIAAVCAFQMGLKQEAYKFAKAAVELDSSDIRLKNNLNLIEKSL